MILYRRLVLGGARSHGLAEKLRVSAYEDQGLMFASVKGTALSAPATNVLILTTIAVN